MPDLPLAAAAPEYMEQKATIDAIDSAKGRGMERAQPVLPTRRSLFLKAEAGL